MKVEMQFYIFSKDLAFILLCNWSNTIQCRQIYITFTMKIPSLSRYLKLKRITLKKNPDKQSDRPYP